MRFTPIFATALTAVSRGQAIDRTAVDNFTTSYEFTNSNSTSSTSSNITSPNGAIYQNFHLVPGSSTQPWSYTTPDSTSSVAILRANETGIITTLFPCLKVLNLTLGCALHGALMAPSPRACNITLTTLPLDSRRTKPRTKTLSFSNEEMIEGVHVVDVKLPATKGLKIEVAVEKGELAFQEELGRNEWGPLFKTTYQDDGDFLVGILGGAGYRIGGEECE